MEENLRRPMGSGDNLWEQIGVSVYPTAGKQTREDALGCREVSSTITRGGKPCCKGGHTVGSRRQGGLYQSIIPCPKVRRLMAPSDKLEITEQVCDYSIRTVKGLMQRGDWLVKLDLKDAYLTVPIHSSHQKISQVLVAGSDMGIQSPPIWSEQCSIHILKTHQASGVHTEEAGNQINPLPG